MDSFYGGRPGRDFRPVRYETREELNQALNTAPINSYAILEGEEIVEGQLQKVCILYQKVINAGNQLEWVQVANLKGSPLELADSHEGDWNYAETLGEPTNIDITTSFTEEGKTQFQFKFPPLHSQVGTIDGNGNWSPDEDGNVLTWAEVNDYSQVPFRPVWEGTKLKWVFNEGSDASTAQDLKGGSLQIIGYIRTTSTDYSSILTEIGNTYSPAAAERTLTDLVLVNVVDNNNIILQTYYAFIYNDNGTKRWRLSLPSNQIATYQAALSVNGWTTSSQAGYKEQKVTLNGLTCGRDGTSPPTVMLRDRDSDGFPLSNSRQMQQEWSLIEFSTAVPADGITFYAPDDSTFTLDLPIVVRDGG